MATITEISHRQKTKLVAPPSHSLRRVSGPSWLNVVSHLDPKYGGLSSAVPALNSAISNTGRVELSLAGFCAESEQYSPALSNGVAVHHMPLGRLAWARNTEARRNFAALVDRSEGVHIHGLWQHSTSVAARLARRSGKPYIVSAHGMLEAWALRNKRLKKMIYAALFERKNVQGAACLHALTEAEARDYRHFGAMGPIAVIPNGVDVPIGVSSQMFLDRFPQFAGKRLILFLGRIHFKKGLDLLMKAWSPIAAKWPEAQVIVAGPDFENTQATVKQLVETLGITDRVSFTGMLTGDMKWSALAAASCFVLPSYSEGLSVSTLEALGMGIPAIVTRQCNLPEVAERECGWVVEAQVWALASALTEFLKASSADQEQMGANGRALVADRYSWPQVGKQMGEVYRWVGGGPLPGEVEIQRSRK